MTRLSDRRKENDKHREKSKKVDSLVHIVPVPSDLPRNRLQPLRPSKSTRLPPLKSQGHQELENRHVPGIVPPLPIPKQDFESFPMGNSLTERNGTEVISKHLTAIESYRKPDNNIHVIAKDKYRALDDVQTKATDVAGNDTCKAEFNESKATDRIRPHPPPKSIKDLKTTSKPSCTLKRFENGKDITWQKEKELLRKHRQQQAERRDISTKPLKATTVFSSSGKEVQHRDQEQEKATKRSSLTQRKKIDLSVSRKCDDDDDWDWDKDIDEFMKIEEKERTNRYTIPGTGAHIEHGNNCEKSPVIFNCTKKGVGFKSKRRIEEEKRQEQERTEKERKEKERRELMIPQKIRKDLKRYGFR